MPYFSELQSLVLFGCLMTFLEHYYPAERQPSRSAAGAEKERDEGDPSPVTVKGLKQPPSAGRRAAAIPRPSAPQGSGGARPSAAGPGVPGGEPPLPSAPLRASCRLPGKLRAAGSPIFLRSMRGVRRGGGVSASGGRVEAGLRGLREAGGASGWRQCARPRSPPHGAPASCPPFRHAS